MHRAIEAAVEACRKSINPWIARPLETDRAAEEERKQDWNRKYKAVEEHEDGAEGDSETVEINRPSSTASAHILHVAKHANRRQSADAQQLQRAWVDHVSLENDGRQRSEAGAQSAALCDVQN